ncbi:hypothetical protein C8R46DRAFT_1030149 [Mycena filopes]|nr:hypothetical protein C8R46DRAFT_1030149 [Mycena filopes]
MFFSASIALTFVLSLSGIAVRSAPIAARADFVPQACSGPNGSGTCVDLNVAPRNQPTDAAACTNVDSPVSLVMNVDNDCVSFPNADCNLDFEKGDFAVEHFSSDDNINSLAPGIKSISCQAFDGLVNGLFPQ